METSPTLSSQLANASTSSLMVRLLRQNFMMDYEYEDFLATEAWADTFALELFSDGISRYEGAEPFGGDIFSLRIYDRKLDAAAAAQNYAAGLPQRPRSRTRSRPRSTRTARLLRVRFWVLPPNSTRHPCRRRASGPSP